MYGMSLTGNILEDYNMQCLASGLKHRDENFDQLFGHFIVNIYISF